MPDFWIDHNATGDDSGGSWANAFPDCATYIADAGSAVGDEVWIASDHLEQTAALTVLAFYDKSVLTSVNSSTDAYTAGARVETSGTNVLRLNCSNADGGIVIFNGVYMGSGDNLDLSLTGIKWIFNYGRLELLSTVNADIIDLTADGNNLILNHSEIKFNKNTQDIAITGGSRFEANDLTLTLPASTDHVFDVGGNGGGTIIINNSDISGATISDVLIEQGSSIDDVGDVYFSRVKVGSYDLYSPTSDNNKYFNFYSVGTADEYYNLEGSFREGDITLSESVVRNATYYSTSKFSLKFLPNANVIEFVNPLRYQLKAPLLDLSAGTKTLTVHIHLQDSAGTPVSLTDKNTKLVAHYADGTDLALGLTVTSNPTIDVVDSSTPLSTVTADFTGAGLSGTYKQHTISLIIPQNTAAGMDEAVVELWLELSTTLVGTTEMFVDPDPVVT